MLVVLTIHISKRRTQSESGAAGPGRFRKGCADEYRHFENPGTGIAYAYLVKRTIEACRVAKDAAATAAEGIATAPVRC